MKKPKEIYYQKREIQYGNYRKKSLIVLYEKDDERLFKGKNIVFIEKFDFERVGAVFQKIKEIMGYCYWNGYFQNFDYYDTRVLREDELKKLQAAMQFFLPDLNFDLLDTVTEFLWFEQIAVTQCEGRDRIFS